MSRTTLDTRGVTSASAHDAVRRPHVVQFYQTDEYLADAVTPFLFEGLASGDGVVVIATEAHRTAFMARLRAKGVDVDAGLSHGQLIVEDARETLARCSDESGIEPERFAAVIDPMVQRAFAAASSKQVRAYGEMVDVLWRSGQVDAAGQAEQMWNDLQARRQFSLMCAYVMRRSPQSSSSLDQILRSHTHVARAENDLDASGPSAEALLRAEIAERAEIERTLRDALRTRQRLEEARQHGSRSTEQITQVTAAIADAVNPSQVFTAIVDRVATALGASTAGLWMVQSDGHTVQLMRSFGYRADSEQSFRSVPLDTPNPFLALDAIARGEPIWIDSVQQLLADYPHVQPHVSKGKTYPVACLPVGVRDRTFGCLALTFEGAPAIGSEQRDVLMLVARYAGHALERLQLLEDNVEARMRAELLHELAHSVITAESVDQVYEAAIEALIRGLAAYRASVLLFDADGVMRFRAWRGLSAEYREAVEGHSPWGRDVEDPQPVVVTDVEQAEDLADFLPLFRQEGIGALAFIPVMAAGQLLGKFMVYYDRPRNLSRAELATASAIADHVAAATNRFEAMTELQRTVRFNEMFAGILGHDLRNPLGAIMTAAQLLVLKSDDDQEILKPVSRILSSGARMSRMIDQLLDFTRVRVGAGIPLARRTTDLILLIRHVIEEIETANPGATLRVEHHGNTLGQWDADRLSQMLSNLLANGVHHGAEDNPVTTRLNGSSPDHVRIDVHNEGTIPPELLPRLFEPMAGGDQRWSKSQGLGLGLFIARQIARAHGGNIEVHSTHEDGTTFSVSLPRETV